MRSWFWLAVFVLLGFLMVLSGLFLRGRFRENTEKSVPPPPGVTIRYIHLRSPEDIQPLGGPLVEPMVYRGFVDLRGLPVADKKKKFFALVLPSVLLAKRKLADLRAEVVRISSEPEVSSEDAMWLEAMLERYRAEDTTDLLRRMEDHPNSVVLAQAALESGWGTSRFFREGNNVFGIWSFDSGEPRLEAGETRGGKRIFVKRYPSLGGSIQDYFTTIGRGPYQGFRHARTREKNPLILIRHLQRYSELGEEYIRRLALTIRSNDLGRFDRYELVPGVSR